MVTVSSAKQKKAFSDALKSARIGAREAQYEVGLMYANGIGVSADLDQAVHWIRQAAERRLPAAQYLLATRYAAGVGVERDEYKALTWFVQAAEQGHGKAYFRLGKLHAVAQKELSLRLMSKSAELGVAEAQFALALEYARGGLGGQDQSAAVFWFREAATQGMPAAQCALAARYAKGQGIPQDLEEALIWYRKAAAQNYPVAQVALELIDVELAADSIARGKGRGKQRAKERRRQTERWTQVADPGDSDARYHLGLMYALGLGVDADPVMAESWYLLAAKQDDIRAQLALAKLYESRGDDQAGFWYGRAAEQGDPEAQFALGRMYSSGQGSAQDHLAGVSWYLKAGELGDSRAMATLGHLFDGSSRHLAVTCFEKAAASGVAQAQFWMAMHYLDVDFNAERALHWCHMAAAQEHVQAQAVLGGLYMGTYGVGRNVERALFWLSKAAEQGDPKAQWNLGSLYLAGGEGLKKDVKLAFVWCQKSAEQDFLAAQATMGVLFARMKNMEQAALWWSKAAEQGDAESQYNLALLHGKGQGVAKNLDVACEWCRKAAEQGVVDAQSRLALMYATGDGVAHDPIEAHKWFLISEAGGDSASVANRAHSESLLTSAQLVEAQRRAREWSSMRKALSVHGAKRGAS